MEGLQTELEKHFEESSVRVVGSVALFTARGVKARVKYRQHRHPTLAKKNARVGGPSVPGWARKPRLRIQD